MPQSGERRCPVCGAPLHSAPGAAAECSQCMYLAPAEAVAAPGAFSPAFLEEFEVVRLIGRGAFGEVYLVNQRSLKRQAVVKFTTGEEAHSLARFEREGQLLARIRHPAIMQVYGSGADGKRRYLLCEYVDGGNLKQRIRAEGRLPPAQAVPLAGLLLDALEHAHANDLIHRDVKSENLILPSAGGAKLADFGLARDMQVTSDLTATGAVLGTPAYFAPELVKGDPPTALSDLYSAGVVLFEMLTGALPTRGPTLMMLIQDLVNKPAPRVDELVPAVTPELADVVSRALEKQPDQRWPDAASFAAALRAAPLSRARPSRRVPRVDSRAGSGSSAGSSGGSRPYGNSRAVLAAVGFSMLVALLVFAATSSHPPVVPAASATTSTAAPLPPVIRTRDGAEMVLVTAGPFLMGNDNLGPSEGPAHEVLLDAYYIDRHEVTNRRFRRFLEESGRRDRVSSHPHPPEMDRDDYPVMDITWDEARGYAEWAGKRLPTEAEWEKAARGTDGRMWPWGNLSPRLARRANCRDRSRDRERDALLSALGEKSGNPAERVDDGFPLTAPVGSYPEGASPYGALDMIGNVWEMCSDFYQADYYRVSPRENPTGPPTGAARAMRGGAFGNAPGDLRVTRRSDHSDHNERVGFRCALGADAARRLPAAP